MKPGVIANQIESLDITSMVDNSILLHVASSNTLTKITISNLSASLVSDRLPTLLLTETTHLIRSVQDATNLIRTQLAMINFVKGTI